MKFGSSGCSLDSERTAGTGDGTVPLASARAEGVKYFNGRRFAFAEDHMALVQNEDVRNCVGGLLKATPDTSARRTPAQQAVVYGRAAGGPMAAELKLQDLSGGMYAEDTSGNITGTMPEGTFARDIPESDFETAGRTQFLDLPGQQPFTATIWAEEAGQGHLRLRLLEGEAAVLEIHYLFELQAGGRARLRFQGPEADLPVLEVDADGDGTFEQQVEPLELPIAEAGEDQEVQKGQRVVLDGSSSRDRLGRPLSYEWQQIGGPAVTLSDPSTASPEFTAPEVDEDVTLTFSLTVTAGDMPSRPDTVSVRVRACGAERCNGSDDDCDGEVDEDDPEAGRDCDTKLGGVCSPGVLRCEGGRLQCVPVESGCALSDCPDDYYCDDGLFCNGAERCYEGMCVPGEPPCTGACEQCDEESRQCLPVEGCVTPTFTPTLPPTFSPTPTPTSTATVSPTPTLTPSRTPTVSQTPTPARPPCTGDCNGDAEVTVDELLAMVNVALGTANLSRCTAGDMNSDAAITVDEIIAAVNNALTGCPRAPSTYRALSERAGASPTPSVQVKR